MISKSKFLGLGILFAHVSLALMPALAAEAFKPNYDEAKVPSYTLPAIHRNACATDDADTLRLNLRVATDAGCHQCEMIAVLASLIIRVTHLVNQEVLARSP